MGDELEPLTTENAPKSIRHGGILVAMTGILVVMAIAGFTLRGSSFGFGVIFGGVLSFANYLWLDRSTRAIFRQDAVASTSILAAKYILRYAALGGILWMVHATGAFPIVAVIAGLATFALAVVLQGLKNIFTSSF